MNNETDEAPHADCMQCTPVALHGVPWSWLQPGASEFLRRRARQLLAENAAKLAASKRPEV